MMQHSRGRLGSLVFVVGLSLVTLGWAQEPRKPGAPHSTDAGMLHGGMRHGAQGGNAREAGRGPGHGHGQHLARMQEVLQLTEEQVGQVRDIMLAAQRQAILQRAELRVAELDLRDAMTRPAVDQAALEKHIQRIGEVRQQLLRQRVEMMTKVHALLTAEQRAKARTFLLDGHNHPRFDAED